MSKKRIFALVAVLALLVSALNVFAQDAAPGSGLITAGVDGEAKELNGAGATFPKPLYDIFFSEYNKLTGVQINYQSIGSGGGIKGISDRSVDFGATDGAMDDKQLAAAKGGKVLHIPTALGGVVMTYNVPELEGKDPIKLTPETITLIAYGDSVAATTSFADVKDFAPLIKWNDPRLVKDNPDLKDVDKFIVFVHRADSSGTTNIFTSYLAAVSEPWKKNVSSGNAVAWPTGIGGKGNAGVSGNVKQTPYTIGYVEAGYARANGLPAALVQNKAGNFVAATAESVSLAAAGVKLPDDLRIKIVNADGDKAYPISGFTWLLVYQNQADAKKGLAIARLAWWVVHDGQAIIASGEKVTDTKDPLYAAGGYAPLPAAAVTKAETLLLSVKAGGKAVLPKEFADAVKPK